MIKSKLLLLALSIITLSGYSQDETWEPQKQITGYLSTEIDYFDFKDDKVFERKYAASIAEAGLLVSYQPLNKLTLKSVFVYRPDFSFDQMLNEVNAEYKVNEYLNLKVGRFLTPLSPMNTYYYAPVNTTATLPMVITHHEFFPLNMDAVSINGKLGDNMKIEYDVFGGGFHNTLWLRSGALGLFGVENDYLLEDTIKVSTTNARLCFGKGGHIGVAYQDYINFGFNIFSSSERVGTTTIFDVEKFTYGFNLKLKLASLQLLGELWRTTVTINNNDYPYNGEFAELSNSFGKVTPYVRYEREDANGNEYNRYTGGINYKPIFETTIKLEYMLYQKSSYDLSGIVATLIYSF